MGGAVNGAAARPIGTAQSDALDLLRRTRLAEAGTACPGRALHSINRPPAGGPQCIGNNVRVAEVNRRAKGRPLHAAKITEGVRDDRAGIVGDLDGGSSRDMIVIGSPAEIHAQFVSRTQLAKTQLQVARDVIVTRRRQRGQADDRRQTHPFHRAQPID